MQQRAGSMRQRTSSSSAKKAVRVEEPSAPNVNVSSPKAKIPQKKKGKPTPFALALVSLLCFAGAYSYRDQLPGFSGFSGFSASSRSGSKRVFSVEELAEHDGSDPSKPLYLAMLGDVYDVTTGSKHYGKSGGYGFFSGRDASAAFVTGNFAGEGLTSDTTGLNPSDILALHEWKEFYDNHKEYHKVGVLAERYYDEWGNPTEELIRIQGLKETGANIRQAEEADRKKFVSCNTKTGGDIPKGYHEVWCPKGDAIYIRDQMTTSGGKPIKRCVCVSAHQLDDPVLQKTECPDDGKLCRKKNN